MVMASGLGVQYQRLKRKAERLRDLVSSLVKAWEDDALTQEEVEILARQAKALLEPEEESP